jgi:L-ascorbate metabolism protein UlaG (beta-lactamase superfamily)
MIHRTVNPRAARRLRTSVVHALAVVATSVFAITPLGAQHASPSRGGDVTVHWIGHAAFEIVSPGGTRILIDPFITANPSAPDSLKQLARYEGANKPAAILVSHAHFDHVGDAKAIAVATGAPVIGTGELVGSLGIPEAQAKGGSPGGAVTVGDVIVHLVPAMHSSEPGHPLGFVLEFPGGRTLYHTGDTGLFGDMALVEELYHPSIMLLCVGGGPYTEDPKTAALAIRKYFHPTTIVPMHYGTFPALATEGQVRAAFAGDRRLVVMTPGETRKF